MLALTLVAHAGDGAETDDRGSIQRRRHRPAGRRIAWRRASPRRTAYGNEGRDAVTGADGRYQIPNVRVGGPYTVTATLSGFRDQTRAERHRRARRRTRAVDFKLTLATVTETVTVSGQATPVSSNRACRHRRQHPDGRRSSRCRRFSAASSTSRARRRSSTADLGQRGRPGGSSASPAATTATTTCRSTAP